MIDSWTKCPECGEEATFVFSLNNAHEDWDATSVYQCPKCKLVKTEDALRDAYWKRNKSPTPNGKESNKLKG